MHSGLLENYVFICGMLWWYQEGIETVREVAVSILSWYPTYDDHQSAFFFSI
jgi:hypothetical protein